MALCMLAVEDVIEQLDPQEKLWPIYVMVVDDEPLLRSLLADELRDSGLTVVEAASADEALSYLGANTNVDLVFTDVQMPGTLDGLQLAASLKAGNPYLPIIVTSGNVSADLAGQHGTFIPKPYRIADAVALVFKALGVEPRGGNHS